MATRYGREFATALQLAKATAIRVQASSASLRGPLRARGRSLARSLLSLTRTALATAQRGEPASGAMALRRGTRAALMWLRRLRQRSLGPQSTADAARSAASNAVSTVDRLAERGERALSGATKSLLLLGGILAMWAFSKRGK